MKSLQTVCLLLATAGLVAAQQYTISTVAGIPLVAGLWPLPNDATVTLATAAQLYHPSVVATDPKGNFYIADSYTYAVRMVTPGTGNIATIAGNGTPGTSGDAGLAISANITDVHGIAVDGSGNIYISDTSSCRIRRIDNPATNTAPNISTFVGKTTTPFCGANSGSPLTSPGALAFDAKGNLYVADYGTSSVYMVTSGGTITTFAGTGVYGNTGDGGSASKATLAYPTAMTFDAAGNLYISDVGNTNIRKVDTSGNITTAATNITAKGLAIDSAGSFYFVDGVSSTVRKTLPTGGVVTLAGSGAPGYGGDGSFNGTVYAGGPSSQAVLNQAGGLAMAPDGSLYVADTMNDVIRHMVIMPASLGIQDAASEVPGSGLLPGSIAPGEILTLFAPGIGPANFTQATVTNGFFPTSLGGTSVTFNGTPAPILYTSSNLVAVVAPYEITGSATASIVLKYTIAFNQVTSTFTTSMPVVTTVPNLFTANSSGIGPAAAVNQDQTINTASNPAKLGSFITLFATGEGYTNAPVDGKTASVTCGIACLPMPVGQVKVKIGNQTVTPSYAGGSPTLIAGVMQVNVQIPATIIPGPVLVQVTVNSYPSQSGVTIFTQ
jgi:uncharacterized protein (TIGR03437 family)